MKKVHIRNDANELRLLFEVCQSLEATGNLGAQMESVLRSMADHTAMLWGGITLSVRGYITHPGGSFVSPGCYGFWLSDIPPGSGEEHPVIIFREAVESMVLETGLPVVMRQETAAPMALHRGNLRTVHKEEVHIFAVPFMQGEKVLGAIFADRIFADSVDAEEDVRLLQAIASLMVRALVARFAIEARHNALVEENNRLLALVNETPLSRGASGERPANSMFPGEISPGKPPAGEKPSEETPALSGTLDSVLGGMERRMITAALTECGGNMVKASARLGITERIMGLRMKKYRLGFKEFRKK